MTTRADYRAAVQHRLLALEDGGYGDFDYENEDYNSFLESSVARLFPAVYKRSSETATLTEFGTRGLASVTPVCDVAYVYRVEDATERIALTGWSLSGAELINIDTDQLSGLAVPTSVTVFFYAPYALADDDVTVSDIPAVYKPLIVLGAVIEALEARQDTGVRGDPSPQGQFIETQLLDRLIPRYDQLKKDLAMSLPGVTL